ncbi:hypothetical protein BS47DRAFT_1395561 [Hydnum rufescens UP504]|uniref:Uncharacterized protein n=1 Tax=Hydnum rufescens UP504 TaxID=1448309 RepID=A0A9P6DRA2_9AGAM|nr:hypothetical protein BS47DRAFT_1395561 [Hydnum rufescens UP504]
MGNLLPTDQGPDAPHCGRVLATLHSLEELWDIAQLKVNPTTPVKKRHDVAELWAGNWCQDVGACGNLRQDALDNSVPLTNAAGTTLKDAKALMDSSDQKLTSEALQTRGQLKILKKDAPNTCSGFSASVISGPLSHSLDSVISRAARLVNVFDDIDGYTKRTTEDGTELFVVTFKTPNITTQITLIGHGNVSLDVARLLLANRSPLNLKSSSIRRIDIVSRRGSSSVSFTATELCELLNLPVAFDAPHPILSPRQDYQQSRIPTPLSKGSEDPPRSTPRRFLFDFSDHHNLLHPPIVRVRHKNGLDHHVVGTPIGLFCVPGRVYSVSCPLVRSVYTSGWAANRARGVLASAMYDAHSVRETLLADRFLTEAGAVQTSLDSDETGMPSFWREASTQQAVRIVHYKRWKIIDEETRRGQEIAKVRERMRRDDTHEFRWFGLMGNLRHIKLSYEEATNSPAFSLSHLARHWPSIHLPSTWFQVIAVGSLQGWGVGCDQDLSLRLVG